MLKMPSSVRIEANKRRILLVPMIFDHTADDGLVLFGHSQPPLLWWKEEISGGNNGGQEVLNGGLHPK